MGARRVAASVAAALMLAGLTAAAPGVSGAPAPAQVVAGDAAPRAKVPVSVTVTHGGRVLVVRVDWNNRLDDRPGRDRFTVRVMAGVREVAQRTWKGSRPGVQTVTIRLTASEVRAFGKARRTGDAVVAVTQQSDSNTDNDQLFERNNATVVRVSVRERLSYREDAPMLRDCSHLVLEPGADLSNCDLAGADLAYMTLGNSGGTNTGGHNSGGTNTGDYNSGGTNTGLPDARLADSRQAHTNLSGADLSGADLRGADLSGVDLTGADLRGADLSGADLSGAPCGPGGPGQTGLNGPCGPKGPR